jgi:hypothetical protein
MAVSAAVAAVLLPAPAHAFERGGWHGGGWGWGWGVGVGVATGLALDAALAGPPYYYPYAPYPYPYPVPAVTVVQPVAVPAAAPVAAPASNQTWYYCENPRGYYPYVGSCQTAWQPVPATPPGAAR